ncbi:MAG: hypothetical protein AAF624_15920, partial [Bacteroidota bacterium]
PPPQQPPLLQAPPQRTPGPAEGDLPAEQRVASPVPHMSDPATPNTAPSVVPAVVGGEDTGSEALASPSPARRWAMALVLILVSAALGVTLADSTGLVDVAAERSGDLLLLVAERGLDVEPDREIADRDAARDFVRAETGLRIQPPRLDGPVLTGAGVALFAGGFPVPLFVVDVAGTAVPVYAVTYAHLDSADGAVTLARPIANRIVARNVHVQPLGPAAEDVLTALVWRDRATIYVALTDDPEAVVDRIQL